jgi:hypothetical protein
LLTLGTPADRNTHRDERRERMTKPSLTCRFTVSETPVGPAQNEAIDGY